MKFLKLGFLLLLMMVVIPSCSDDPKDGPSYPGGSGNPSNPGGPGNPSNPGGESGTETVVLTAADLPGVWTHNEMSTYVFFAGGDGQTFITQNFWQKDIDPMQTSWSLYGNSLTITQLASRDDEGVYKPVVPMTHRLTVVEVWRDTKTKVVTAFSVRWGDGEVQMLTRVTTNPGVNPFR